MSRNLNAREDDVNVNEKKDMYLLFHDGLRHTTEVRLWQDMELQKLLKLTNSLNARTNRDRIRKCREELILLVRLLGVEVLDHLLMGWSITTRERCRVQELDLQQALLYAGARRLTHHRHGGNLGTVTSHSYLGGGLGSRVERARRHGMTGSRRTIGVAVSVSGVLVGR